MFFEHIITLAPEAIIIIIIIITYSVKRENMICNIFKQRRSGLKR